MSTKKKAKTTVAEETTLPNTQSDNPESKSFTNEELQQVTDYIRPMVEFFRPHEGMTMEDVRILWNVTIIRGANTHFASTNGSSTLNGMFAERCLPVAPEAAVMEITDKILLPLAAAVQTEANRMALEITSTEQSGDLAPLT